MKGERDGGMRVEIREYEGDLDRGMRVEMRGDEGGTRWWDDGGNTRR